MDLWCGIGGDRINLAGHAWVWAVDRDPRRVLVARMNCAACGVTPPGLAVADVRHLQLRGEARVFDPVRRGSGGGRARRASGYSPPLDWFHRARGAVPEVAVKVSPAIDEVELPADCEVEYVSAAAQCREATLYCGNLATAERRATVLPGEESLQRKGGPTVPVGPPGRYLCDLDPAVVRAHLIDELGLLLAARNLGARSAYLTADSLAATPFASSYEVLGWRPLHPARPCTFLASEGLLPRKIRWRHFLMRTEAVRRVLASFPGGTRVTQVLTRLTGRPACLICQDAG